MPGTLLTVCPFCGEIQDVPWMSWMRSGPGSSPPPPSLVPEFVGVGADELKSVELSSVSAPLAARWVDVVLAVAGAGEPSRITAVPQPTRSTIELSAAQSPAVLQVSAVAEWTSAPVPAVPLMAMLPVLSGVGSAPAEVFDPAASPIRKWAFWATLPLSGVICHVVVDPGLAEMYWTDQPVRSAAPV